MPTRARQSGSERRRRHACRAGALAAEFAKAGLLDEIQLGLIPVTLGVGKPLLPARFLTPMALSKVEQLGKGMLMLTYQLPKR